MRKICHDLTSEDKILVKLLQDNSTQAFDALYKRYSARLYNFVMKISNYDVYISEEIVQRVFIKIWEIKEKLDPEKSFNSFLSTIAKNMLLNEYNHIATEFIYKNYVLISSENTYTSFEEKIEYTFFKDYLLKLIDKLPPACREVYKLSRFESFSNKEIAMHLNKSESTVEKQIIKANKFIKENIQQYHDKIFLLMLFLQLF